VPCTVKQFIEDEQFAKELEMMEYRAWFRTPELIPELVKKLKDPKATLEQIREEVS
jgi:hypothetical protein